MPNSDKTKAAILRWVKEKRKEAWAFIQAEKERRGCERCRRRFPYYVLDLDHLDHLDPNAKPHSRRRSNGSLAKTKDQAVQLLAASQVLCAVCHRIKTAQFEDHLRHQAQPKGKPRKPSICRMRERRKQAAAGALAEAKDGPCTDCGERHPAVAMDFDHVSGEKLLAVSRLKSASVARVLAELEKCELVCANCHRIRTHMRQFAADGRICSEA